MQHAWIYYVVTLYKYLYYKYYLLIYFNMPTYIGTYYMYIHLLLFRFGGLDNDVPITVIIQMPRRHKK